MRTLGTMLSAVWLLALTPLTNLALGLGTAAFIISCVALTISIRALVVVNQHVLKPQAERVEEIRSGVDEILSTPEPQ